MPSPDIGKYHGTGNRIDQPESLLHPDVGVVVVPVVVRLASYLEAVVGGERSAVVAAIQHAAGQAGCVQSVCVLQSHQT